MSARQGDVWDIRFGKDSGDRPGIVVTRNDLNKGRIVLVVPCTSSHRTRRNANNVLLKASPSNGLSVDSFAQVHLIQPVSYEWFISKRGRLSEDDLGSVLQALAWAIDLYEY